MDDVQKPPFQERESLQSVESAREAPPLPPPMPARIAGFWQRLGAYVVDLIILGSAGYVAGLFLFEQLTRTGPWGRAIGFAIALLYFGTFNSGLGGGQTPGKRLFGIKVVGEDGGGLPLVWSLVRYSILALNAFLSGLLLPSALMQSWIATMLNVVSLGVGGATLYLFIFNSSTRQVLHDLAVGSYVVKVASEGAPAVRPLWWLHGVVVALWMLAALWITVALSPDPMASRDLLEARREIDQLDHVRTAMVLEVNFGAKMIVAVAVFDAVPESLERTATDIAGIVLDTCSQRAPEKNLIVVQVQCGYDLGICHSWKSIKMYKSPQDWEKAIKAAK